jgi:hypothetical protein
MHASIFFGKEKYEFSRLDSIRVFKIVVVMHSYARLMQMNPTLSLYVKCIFLRHIDFVVFITVVFAYCSIIQLITCTEYTCEKLSNYDY